MGKKKQKENRPRRNPLKNPQVFAVILMYGSCGICLISSYFQIGSSLAFFLTTFAISSIMLLVYTTWRVVRSEHRTWEITKETKRINRLMEKQIAEPDFLETVEENHFPQNQQDSL